MISLKYRKNESSWYGKFIVVESSKGNYEEGGSHKQYARYSIVFSFGRASRIFSIYNVKPLLLETSEDWEEV